MAIIAGLGVVWIALARYAPDSVLTSDGLPDRLARIDVAASALAILAGAAHAVRWKIDGYAPSWWIGAALLAAALPGIATTADSESAVALHLACSLVATAAFVRALRSTEVDTALAPVRSALAGAAMLAVLFVAFAAALDRVDDDRLLHLAVGVLLVGVTIGLSRRWRRSAGEPWGTVAPFAAGLAVVDLASALVEPANPLHGAGGALVRLAAMSFPVVGAIADLMAAAALQRHAAYREHLGREVAEHRQRAAEERFAETLHEVRSTVVALEGGVRRLAPPEVDDDQSANLARALAGEIERLRALVSSDPRANTTSYRVRDALEPMLTVSRSGGWPVSWDIPDDLVVRGHAADLAQIVHGLLTNATRYAPATPIDVSAESDGAFVTIRVGDRGPGVARGHRELIFERGRRGADHPDQAGQGLGLYIARNLARGQGGDLWVEQRAGGGASFVVALPSFDDAGYAEPDDDGAALSVVGPADEKRHRHLRRRPSSRSRS